MSNLTQRIITAIIGATLVIGAILYGESTFLLLLLLITVLGVTEFYRLLKQNGFHPQVAPGVLLAVLPFLSPLISASTGLAWNGLPFLLVLPYLLFIRQLYLTSDKPFTDIALTFLGPFYIAFPLFLFYLYSFQGNNTDHYHPTNVLGFLFLLWSADSGAYFAGRFLGKHKLFERISQKKTWEGFVGGLALSLLVSYFIGQYYTNLSPSTWMILSVIITVTGAWGDLVESMFKRSLDIKDSGTLLPGHGGVLDRFDGLFIAAPFVFTYLLLLS